MRHGNLSGAGILLLFAVGGCSSFLESGGSSPPYQHFAEHEADWH
jgi:hypothetical protein